MEHSGKPNKIRLSTNPTNKALSKLKIGDIVYLDGVVYTGREGVYMSAIEDGEPIPMDLPAESAANFHCSPAAVQNEDGYSHSLIQIFKMDWRLV